MSKRVNEDFLGDFIGLLLWAGMLLGLLFGMFKLSGFIDWPWWAVMLPIYVGMIPIAFTFLALLVALLVEHIRARK